MVVRIKGLSDSIYGRGGGGYNVDTSQSVNYWI